MNKLIASLVASVSLVCAAQPIVPSGDDDYAVLSAAIAAGGTVELAAGEFKISAQLTLDRAVTLVGQGRDKTVIKPTKTGFRALGLSYDDACVRGIAFDGFNNSANSNSAGVSMTKGLVEECEFRNIKSGGWGTNWNKVGPVAHVTGGVIRRSVFHDNAGGTMYGYGAWIAGGTVDSCLFYNFTVSESGRPIVRIESGTLRNCTFSRISLPASTYVVELTSNKGWLRNTIVDVDERPWTGQENNRVANYQGNPGFVNSSIGNYHLRSTATAAIEVGDVTDIAEDAKDLDGEPRLRAGKVDLGCYQYVAVEPYVKILPQAATGFQGWPVAFALEFDGVPDETPIVVDFGDGTTLETRAETFSHIYETAGTYTVKASVPSMSLVDEKADCLAIAQSYKYITNADSLETAIGDAHDYDTIWLADGDYTFGADARITISRGVRVMGQSKDPGKVVISPHTANKHMMFELDHENSGLFYLTIQGGYNGNQNEAFGCNVKITDKGGTVSHCVIRNGKASGYGGAAAGVCMAAGLVTHSILSNNTAHAANAGKKPSSAITMTGGRLENSLVTANTGTGANGAPIYVSGGATVVNCTIAGNTSAGCAGVYFESPSAGDRIINTLVCDNTSTGQSGDTVGIYNNATYADRFKACAAPILVNESCQTADDLKLAAGYVPLSGSVCRDHGTTDGITVAETDLAGNPRVDESGLIDIGCYEFTVSGLSASIAANPSSATGVTPLTVTYTAEVEGGTPSGYRWFEDGVELSGETGSTLVRTYTTPGKPVVSLKVSDGTSEYDAANTIAVAVYPAVLNVDADHSLDDAYAAAGDGTLVLVAPGTYKIATRWISKGVTIRGTGDRPSAVAFKPKSSNSRVFALNHEAARLENLTVADGSYNQQGDPGSGVYIYGRGGTVSNCVIASCNHYGDASGGGGAYLGSVNAVVTHCIITNCTSSRSRDLGSPHCGGAAILLDAGLVRETLIANCRGGEGTKETDGAVSIYGGKVVNCTIAGCRNGGCAGVRAHGGQVVNTIVSGNTTTSGNVTNAVYAGSASVFDTCLSDGEEPINNTCLVEPVDATFRNFSQANYVLKGGSLGRDAGKAQADAPSVDIRGRARLFGKSIDIGCYESDTGGLTVLVK